jgi:IS605 OrfB family transposase
MATKMYRARLIEVPPRLKGAIGRTHRAFVTSLQQMILRYLQMRKGRYGDDCRRLAEMMLRRSNTFAHGVMDKLSRPCWETRLSDEWVTLANRVCQAQGPLFDQHEGFAVVDGITIHTKPQGKIQPTRDRLAVPAKFWHQVCDSASAYLKHFDELLARWREGRREWLTEKGEWEEAHPEFMQFWHGPYAQFEQTCEQQRVAAQNAADQTPTTKKHESRERGKRVVRWHLWYEWIVSHPDIVGWRGQAQASDFQAIPAETQAQIKRKSPRQDKYVPEFLKWLDANNPELAKLNTLRRQYVSNYLKYNRPPTFTLPSFDRHPYWFTFERNQFYKQVDFERGAIQLLLIDEKPDGSWFFQWFPARIKCDPRLIPSKRAALFAKDGRYPPYVDGKVGKTLNRPAKTGDDRKAGYAGAKLVLRPSRAELLLTVVEQDAPPKVKWQKLAERRCYADNWRSGDGQQVPLTVMALDLGIRHPAGYVIAEGTAVDGRWQMRWRKKGMLHVDEAPALRGIRRHDRALKAERRRRGKPVEGEKSLIQLQDHRTGMAQDRFKKVANAIVEISRRENVDLVLFERLTGLSPTAFDERWMNRQLRDMNRRQIVQAVQQTCPEFGIACKDYIPPHYTSHVCSKCFRPGWRFSMKCKDPYKEQVGRRQCRQYGYPVWDQGGHLFRCPHCGYTANADINAAANIAAKFFGLWPNMTRSNWQYTWQEEAGPKVFAAKEAFEEWAKAVAQRKTLGETPF